MPQTLWDTRGLSSAILSTQAVLSSARMGAQSMQSVITSKRQRVVSLSLDTQSQLLIGRICALIDSETAALAHSSNKHLIKILSVRCFFMLMIHARTLVLPEAHLVSFQDSPIVSLICEVDGSEPKVGPSSPSAAAS